MDLWTLLAIAVVSACLLAAYREYTKSRSASGNPRLEDLESRVAALEGQEGLEERVRALEAIVTDPKARLEREITELND